MERVRVCAAPLVVATALLALSLLVGGCGSADDAPTLDAAQSKAAVEQYRSYLEQSAAELVAHVEKTIAEIKADEPGEASTAYAVSRVSYSQVEPAAKLLFGDLAARIDPDTGEAPAESNGLDRIEAGLWEEKLAETRPHAEELLADARELRRRLATAKLTAAQIVEGAEEALGEASATAVHGGQEPNSLLDLIEVSANVEGVGAAFEAVKPLLEEADPELVAEIKAELADAYAGLRNFGRAARRPSERDSEAAGTAFVRYGQRTQTEYDELGEKIDALAAGISDASALLAP